MTLGVDLNYLDENREGTYLGSAAFSGGGLIQNTPVNSEDNNRRVDVSSDLKYQINDSLSGETKYIVLTIKKEMKQHLLILQVQLIENLAQM